MVWRSGPTVGDEPHRCHSLGASRRDRVPLGWEANHSWGHRGATTGEDAVDARTGGSADTGGDTLGSGILGPGRIARSFATDLREVPGARLAAIGSRTPG